MGCFLDVVGVGGDIVPVGPVCGKAGAGVGVGGVGDSRVSNPGASVGGIRVRLPVG